MKDLRPAPVFSSAGRSTFWKARLSVGVAVIPMARLGSYLDRGWAGNGPLGFEVFWTGPLLRCVDALASDNFQGKKKG